ncbi:MAG: right-handed parallel beta-helix repeat-containing protein, partial [Planctomycetaceae bacterium]|nr:right-handed parallel beta-helix repeat-containing protein [Planctomycetaceae bacterium]
AGLGVHPGSGSQRPILRNNKLERNRIGIFWCWGVKYGLAEHNMIDGNLDYGISIGHCDTDNVMRHNKVLNSGKVGVLFRNDTRGQDFWANRNTLEHNHIANSGPEGGIAIDINGKTKEVRIVGNTIEETREALKRTGIRIAAEAGKVHLEDNKINGFSQAISDLRKT